MAGLVTTNASTVAVPPPAERDAVVVAALRKAGADLFCKTNLLEYAAGSVNPLVQVSGTVIASSPRPRSLVGPRDYSDPGMSKMGY